MAQNKEEDEDEDEDQYGFHFGKADIYRAGFFDDPPAGPFDVYSNRPPGSEFRQNLAKNRRQMLCRQRGGLFERRFQRIFTGEALPELGQQRKAKRKGKEKKKIEPLGVLMPPNGPKYHSSPGDWYGCIGKQPKHFSPVEKEPEIRELTEEERNPTSFYYSSPGKFGGPGYVDICLNPYLANYMGPEPYDLEFEPMSKEERQKKRFFTMHYPRPYFDDNPYRAVAVPPAAETPGPRGKPFGFIPPKKERFYCTFPRTPYGRYSGCFDGFPRWYPDPGRPQKRSKGKPRPPIRPPGGPSSRSKYTTSIIDRVTSVACNATNYTTYREQVYPLS